MVHKAKILIGNSNRDEVEDLLKILAENDYKTSFAATHDEFDEIVKSGEPDAVLLGQFPDVDQAEIANSVIDFHAPRPIPLMLFNCEKSQELRQKAIASGVQDLIEDIPQGDFLIRRMTLLTRLATMQNELDRRVETAKEFNIDISPWSYDRFDGRSGRVLIISQDNTDNTDLKACLESFDLELDFETDYYRAADRLDAERFDAAVVIPDSENTKEQAMYLCSHLRNNPRQFNMPIIIMSDEGILGDINEVYRAGATIVVEGSDDLHLIGTHCKMLVNAQRAKWSMRDPMMQTQTDETCDNLHGVYSVDFFNRHLDRVVKSFQKSNGQLSLAIFAIRNAPDVKQRFGEEACEMLMQQMADWIQGLLRTEDMTARIGEYEFAVILPSTPLDKASMVANRITGILHHSEFRLTDEIMEAINVWVDLGVTSLNDSKDASEFLTSAKKAIY
ncbi:MAG: diguanylate cyclase [Alphaproteobacteria bacterium]|nr:diguanylate cyclase [Alphaproteobacteria bacterium]